MTSYTRNTQHIIFSTKNRRPTIAPSSKRQLFAYMHGILKELDCHLYRLNGVEDHVHLLIDLHSTVSLANLVRTLKTSSGEWMRTGEHFPDFDYWQEGYGAFSIGWREREGVIEYIKGQEDHHRRESFLDEYRRIVEAAGLEWNALYLP